MEEMSFGPGFWGMAGLSAAAALVYGLALLDQAPSLARALVKTAFMGCLAGAFYLAHAREPLLLAFGAAALGDFFLAFDKKWILPFGIAAFLIQQALYLLIFLVLWMFSPDNSPLLPRYLMMALIVVTAFGFLITMAPKLGWMALGVAPYSIVITAMASAAMWLPWAGWPAMIGALLFLASDFVLAAELFALAREAPVRRITAPLVWWTYAAAQLLIAWGVVLSVKAMV